MQNARRILIAILGIAALTAGATAASADRGHHHGGGTAERLFTLAAGSRRQSRGGHVRPPLAGVLRRHHGRRRDLPRHARQRHRRAVHRGRDRQGGRRAQGATRQALRRGRPDRRDHRLRPRHQGGGRDVPDRHGRVPQRPRRHPPRRRLRHRLVPADAVARDRRAGGGRQRDAAGARRQRDPVRGRRVQRSTASSRRATASSSSSTRNSGKLFRIALAGRRRVDPRDRRDHGRHGAGRRRHAARPAGGSWSCRAARAQLSFLKLRGGARRATLEAHADERQLRGPSTVDRAKGLYLVVNADFATSQKPFTVAGLPARSKHGHHGHHGH